MTDFCGFCGYCGSSPENFLNRKEMIAETHNEIDPPPPRPVSQ
jgi:hypothetical protein